MSDYDIVEHECLNCESKIEVDVRVTVDADAEYEASDWVYEQAPAAPNQIDLFTGKTLSQS
ncbi:MAG: hypothetical protein ACPG5P_01120 [Saprospiraceae bacterium]